MHPLSLNYLNAVVLISSLLIISFPSPSLLQSIETCSPFSCNPNHRDTIQFPFRVPENQTLQRCGYPGFELSCNSGGQTLLNLPSSSSPSDPFIVRGIDYMDQIIFLSDPNKCIPKRILNLTLSGTPYSSGPTTTSYSFLNCSNLADRDPDLLPDWSSVISCLSGGNYTVVATFERSSENKLVNEWRCEVIKRVFVPLWWPQFGYGYYPMDLSDVFIQLSWNVPACGACQLRGGSCGFVSGSGLDVGCFVSGGNDGLPRSAKYGLILGAGIPGVVCMVGLTLYISSRVRARNQVQRHSNTEFSPSIFPHPAIITSGLDRPTIESYPKTVLGESKRLPNPSDGICPICLSEYQPKDTLRSIPDCNHYFHAECIDEWLRMNATCPLCRNSPQKPFAVALP